MKHIIYILVFGVTLSACNDFLDYKDGDKVIPDELEQYSELIYGELVRKSIGATCYNTWIMSDDYMSSIPSWIGETNTDERENYFSWYTWAAETQITPRGDELIDPAWEHFYHKILMCNIIEKEVGGFEDDLEGVKFRLLGEVQVIRAMSYWYLLNLYGEPFRDAEQAKGAMGVPVNTETGIEDHLYTREPLAEVYKLIETDLQNALQNLDKGEQKNSIFHPNQDVARLFLSRVYLEQKRYEDVIAVCNTAMEKTSRSIMSLADMANYTNEDTPMLNKNNGSILFSWADRDALPCSSNNYYQQGIFAPSTELLALFASNDLRNKGYALVDLWDPGKVIKYEVNFSGCYTMNYRLEEFYFNRAEAYIETGQWETGMEDLNVVYSQRIEGGEGKLSATSVEDARECLRTEKRKEFCFEDMRWFDIRRWNLSVEHRYHDFSMDGTYRTYVLEEGSPNYVLPIPLDIQRRNFEIEQPERVDIEPTIN